MNGAATNGPHALSSSELARRLAELAGEERQTQVEFLLHLDAFDRRRAWADAGYGSLWEYLLEALHFREGGAWLRFEAMKLLRRFPSVEPALRDGRLCLSTLTRLGKVLTEENVSDLVTRAAFLSKAETERLVVSIRPGVAPKDGVRRISAPDASPAPLPDACASEQEDVGDTFALPIEAAGAEPVAAAPGGTPIAAVPPATLALPCFGPGADAAAAALPRLGSELRPVAAETFSLRVTIDASCKTELDQLVSLLSHKTGGNLAEVLREAIRCGIQKHGKRRGAVEPDRKRAPVEPLRKRAEPEFLAAASPAANEAPASEPTDDPPLPPSSRYVPVDVRRAVWKRAGGRCEWTSTDGKRCGSTWSRR